ncbi:glucosaminidase domain-containing protein [Mollicutes bacterium LVI A0078]|nr:glucosaminidase domain-containing protein [Mollicutes bacterium LVI A0078]
MFVTIVGSQFTGIATNVSLYASEIQSTSNQEVTSEDISAPTEEVSSEEISEVSSDTVLSEEEEDTASETVESESDQDSEVSSQSEVASVQVSQVESEVISETTSDEGEVDASNIEAQITIDEDGALATPQTAIPTAFRSASQLNEDENLTSYQNQLRLDANSGESSIKIDFTSKSKALSEELTDTPIYYTINEDGDLANGSTKQPKSYEGNLITVLNGTIIDSDSAIVRTSGGYNKTFYIYSSIADLKSETDGIPVSGGGFDGTFIETVEEDGKYYTHLKISGYEGYTEAGNVQIVPEQLIKSRSYYTSEDGSWVYHSAIDPVTSTEYDTMAIGEAPANATVGVKYYTDDDATYYTDQIITEADTKSSVSYNSYFQNLPFRSVSNYTAADYKSYLKAKGKTDSVYYNETNAFTDAQSKESVNSLLIFSMANHESAYGLSTYAKACNNFFGRGAIDSDPDKACQQYGYPTPTDGILAQALFLQNGYFDVLDWRYAGTHVGNKASGMNVKYASDTDWGKKISNHAYMMDQYMNGKEEDKYAIAKVSGKKYVYTGPKLATKVKSSNDSQKLDFYDLSQMTGTSNTVNVVALQQESGAYQIYVPTAVKQSSSSDCSFTNSMGGKYPNYGGRTKKSVATGTANYSCDYENFTRQKYWISKSNTSIINDKSVPYTTHTVKTYDDNGNLQFSFVVNNTNDVIRFAYRYDTKGNIIKKYVYQDGTVYGDSHWNKYKTVYDVKNGQVTKAQSYTTAQNVQYIYTYYDGATLSNNTSYMKNRFDIDPKTGYIKQANAYTKGANRKRTTVYTYNPKTKYGNHTANLKWKFNLNTSNGDIINCYQYIDGANSGFNKVYTYVSGTKYGSAGVDKYKDVFWLKGKNNEIDYAYRYENGVQTKYYTYVDGTQYGSAGVTKYKDVFWLKGNNKEIDFAYRYEDGKRTKRYTYVDGTKLGSQSTKTFKDVFWLENDNLVIDYAMRYSNGVPTKVYTYVDGTKIGNASTKTFRDVFWLKNGNMEIDYAVRYVNGERYKHYTYDEGTRWGVDKLSDHIKETFYY